MSTYFELGSVDGSTVVASIFVSHTQGKLPSRQCQRQREHVILWVCLTYLVCSGASECCRVFADQVEGEILAWESVKHDLKSSKRCAEGRRMYGLMECLGGRRLLANSKQSVTER